MTTTLSFAAVCAGVYLLALPGTYVVKPYLFVALVAVVAGTVGLCQ